LTNRGRSANLPGSGVPPPETHRMGDRPPALLDDHRLAEILDATEDGIVTVNARHEIVLFNRGASVIFGYDPAEVLGRPLDILVPDSARAGHSGQVEAFARGPVAARAMGDRRTVTGRRKDGTEIPVEITISRLVADGELLLTAIVRDARARKKYEDALVRLNPELEDRVRSRTAELTRKTEELRAMTQQLWQAARLAGVGELAASIAHELNNPLGTVSLRVEGVLAKTPPDDPRRGPLEVIDQEVARMARLVGNLLQFSRAGRDQVSTVDVCEEVAKTIDLTEHHMRRRGVRVEPDFAPAVPDIYADRQHLRQVFLNLFTNAADAMPAGGRLVPRVRAGELPGAVPAVVVEVTDTGVGIPPEHLPRVFDPFFTTKEEGKGTGLGLAICRRIVRQHQGTLEVESRVNEGTTVRVTLPVRNEANVSGLRHDL
jgi:two-component system, LuxR family, sensor kinase FixL